MGGRVVQDQKNFARAQSFARRSADDVQQAVAVASRSAQSRAQKGRAAREGGNRSVGACVRFPFAFVARRRRRRERKSATGERRGDGQINIARKQPYRDGDHHAHHGRHQPHSHRDAPRRHQGAGEGKPQQEQQGPGRRRAFQNAIGEDVIHRVGLKIDGGDAAGERGIAVFKRAQRRHAEDDQSPANRVGRHVSVQQLIQTKHRVGAARANPVHRREAVAVERNLASGERNLGLGAIDHRFLFQKMRGGAQRQRRKKLVAPAQQMRHAPHRAGWFGKHVEMAQSRRARGKRGERRCRPDRVAHAQRRLIFEGETRRNFRGFNVRSQFDAALRDLKGAGQRDIARRAALTRQFAVFARTGPWFGQQHIEGDGFGAHLVQPLDGARIIAARQRPPYPAALTGAHNCGLIDGHDDDARVGIARPPRAKQGIERAAFQTSRPSQTGAEPDQKRADDAWPDSRVETEQKRGNQTHELLGKLAREIEMRRPHPDFDCASCYSGDSRFGSKRGKAFKSAPESN